MAKSAPKIQVELLRVLEEKQVVRLGGTKPTRADFRIVAATNKDLMQEVQAGRFREDLYYRLNVFHISIPPLRERQGDIPILVRAFVERLAQSMNRPVPQVSQEAMQILENNAWPGNVRELANAMERHSDEITAVFQCLHSPRANHWGPHTSQRAPWTQSSL